MKKTVIALILTAAAFSSYAQTANDYLQKYNLLVKRFGPAAVGVETILQQWEKMDSTDIDLHIARYNHYLARSSRDTVVAKDSKKYLGNAPVLSLKDSTGRNVNFFQTTLYDSEIFAKALSSLEKAASLDNTRLDIRFEKINALIMYEKETPELSLRSLMSLIDENYSMKPDWTLLSTKAGEGYFEDSIQDYCYTFFKLSTPEAYGAFRAVSERMLKFNPKNVNFLDNVGTYYLIAQKNEKKALKYYRKALKINPDDEVASKNVSLISNK